jgi:hypothetical protein
MSVKGCILELKLLSESVHTKHGSTPDDDADGIYDSGITRKRPNAPDENYFVRTTAKTGRSSVYRSGDSHAILVHSHALHSNRDTPKTIHRGVAKAFALGLANKPAPTRHSLMHGVHALGMVLRDRPGFLHGSNKKAAKSKKTPTP